MAIFRSKKLLFTSFIIAVIYIIFAIYVMNFNLVVNTIFGNFSTMYKVTLLTALLEGMWTAMTHTAFFLLILTAILTGVNLTIIGSRLTTMKRLKNAQYIAGGGSLLGIISSGCVACGLPIISLLGLSGSVVYLPLHGTELSYIALFLLSLSFYFLVKNSRAKGIDQCSTSLKRPLGKTQFAVKEVVV